MNDQYSQPGAEAHNEPDAGAAGLEQLDEAKPAGRRVLVQGHDAASTRPSTSDHSGGGPVLAKGKTPPAGTDRSKIVVPLVAVLIALIGIWWVAATPEDGAFKEARDGIESIDDLNNESTAGAPQQEVVNGWTTIEYLNLLSTQQEHESNRRDALLLLILLSGLGAYTHHSVSSARRERSSDPS
jgi:hypothetical protein